MENTQFGKVYRHYKGNLYQVLCMAEHTEGGESLVIYQALYGEFKVYARPAGSFFERLDPNKYPDAKQTYRFEEVGSLANGNKGKLPTEEAKAAPDSSGADNETGTKGETKAENLAGSTDGVEIPVIMRFLDARTSKEKLDVIRNNVSKIDDRTIANIEASLDVVSDSNNLDDRINYICDILRTRSKYENTRLR